jgi:hypothetical protein
LTAATLSLVAERARERGLVVSNQRPWRPCCLQSAAEPVAGGGSERDEAGEGRGKNRQIELSLPRSGRRVDVDGNHEQNRVVAAVSGARSWIE